MRNPVLAILIGGLLVAAAFFYPGRSTSEPITAGNSPTSKTSAAWHTRGTTDEIPSSDSGALPDSRTYTGHQKNTPAPLPLEQDPAALAEMRTLMPDLQIIPLDEADSMPRPEDVAPMENPQEDSIGYVLDDNEIKNYPMPVILLQEPGQTAEDGQGSRDTGP